AGVPALFAVHTFSAAFVWWGLRGVIPSGLGDVASTFFMFVAFVLLPVYVPVAVLLLEPRGWRRHLLAVLSGIGLVAGVEYLWELLNGHGTAVACNLYIDYSVAGVPSATGALYILGTCGALLLSGHRQLFLWGVVNAAMIAGLTVWSRHGLPSLWCWGAAVTSGFVAWYIRHLSKERELGLAWPWERQSASTFGFHLPRELVRSD
ncbi:MAG: DUF6629 family protein, partial [Actinomycetes bacterium]